MRTFTAVIPARSILPPDLALLLAPIHARAPTDPDMLLQLASGEENFTPFGSEQLEHPLPGEVIFAEGSTVLTRRWTWRQANHTLTLPETRALEINVDGLPPMGPAEIEAACLESMRLVEQFCGGRARYEILSEQNPRILLDV